MNDTAMEAELSKEAVRILGVLMEKEMSTPEYYPLTLNSLRTGCNQKSNRSPVVSFGELEIMGALDELKELRLVGHVSGAGSRTDKYRHALAEAWELSAAECAVLACLALRGAQTMGEIRGRTGRLYTFSDMAEAESTFSGLCDRAHPLVVQIAKMPGQKEARYVHLMSGEPEPEALQPSIPIEEGASPRRDELDRLRDDIARLREEFEAFRSQFE